MREPPRHPDMPTVPQDGDGPVFREPWEAQAFALVLDLYDKGCFTWSEWVGHLSREIATTGGNDTTGTDYYKHWLTALEKLVTAKGLLSAQDLAERKQAWAVADRHRGFGEPIKLA